VKVQYVWVECVYFVVKFAQKAWANRGKYQSAPELYALYSNAIDVLKRGWLIWFVVVGDYRTVGVRLAVFAFQ